MATTPKHERTDGDADPRTARSKNKRPQHMHAYDAKSTQLTALMGGERVGDENTHSTPEDDESSDKGRRPPSTSDMKDMNTTPAAVARDIRDIKTEVSDKTNLDSESYRSGEDDNVKRRKKIDATEQKTASTNWNAIKNTKVRTSLRSRHMRSEAGQAGKSQRQAKTKDGEKSRAKGETQNGNEAREDGTERDKATRVAKERLDGCCQRLSTMNPHDGPVSAHKSALQELYAAEVDYNYCLFYPDGAYFLRPPTTSDRTRERTETASQEKRLRLWQATEKCMKNGTLHELRDGRILGLAPEKLDERGRQQQSEASRVDRVDPLESQVTGSSARDLETTRGGDHGNNFSDNTRQTVVEMIGGTNAKSVADFNQGIVERQTELNDTSHELRDNTESDGDVLLNLHESATGSQGSESEIGNGSESNDGDSEYQSKSEEGDAMMEYSNSEQVTAQETKYQSQPSVSSRNIHILAELSSEDLDAQVRYFHVTKSSREIDLNTPVGCLVCAQLGHMAEVCTSLTCTACGAYNQHVTRNCPTSARCSKCREPGHDKQHCPYKLKNIAQSEILCDLCQQNGHAEEECELIWRTSGRPWESKSSGNNVRRSCYECGRSGHLGNDCPTRRPGKPMGTSTWGSGSGQMSIKSKGDLSIKGRAQNPIDLDDSGDELAFFHRPKIPGPGRKAQIRVNTAPKNSMVNRPIHPGSKAVDDPYSNGRGPEAGYPSYRDDDRENERPHGRKRREVDCYRPGDRRSVSPAHRDHAPDFRGDRYQHQVPPARKRAARGGELYRPMPSSGDRAWVQHRL